MKKNKVAQNMAMLYLMTFAKLVLPLMTLPYLTRILTEEAYGLVTYVKNCMVYMHLIIDFGFLLSSVKDIVNAGGDKGKINIIIGNTFGAKMILTIGAGIILTIMALTIPILRVNVVYVILSFIGVAITVFLADFLFRGIEKMQYVTIIFVTSKAVATALTFILIQSDNNLILMPILDIVANLVSVSLSWVIMKRLGFSPRMTAISDCFKMLKESFVYFLSNVASTVFSALNTIVIGIYLTDLKQVAYWGLCLNIILAIEGMYAPICNSIYPHMIKEKDMRFIKKIMAIFMPIVTCGCLICFFFSKEAMLIVGGEKYIPAHNLFRCMVPILFFCFPVQVFGWPTLGAIGKEKETTLSTIVGSVAQILGIFGLILINRFSVINLAILRVLTEFVLFVTRGYFVYKNRKLFKEAYDKRV